VFVEETEEAAQAAAHRHYGAAVTLRRDQDVLDTWFSSALWPFSTLGWPDSNPEVARYYPGDVLVTGFDIIFFWVARMMMMGLHFMGDVPFHTVYIHALVRDERGQKMSKSKGNIIDPLHLVDEYGTDALRFTLTALAAQGRDIKLSPARVEGYRNFATKLWNAARYCEMNRCPPQPGFTPTDLTQTVNRWIVSALVSASERVTAALEAYKFNEAASALYQFTWGTFCDWYLEFTKPILAGGDAAAQAETRAVTAWVLDQVLILLHPVMPYITEELWERLSPTGAEGRPARLISTPWPNHDRALIDEAALGEMDWVVRLVSAVRAVRSEMNVPPASQPTLLIRDAGSTAAARLATHRDLILRLARLASVELHTGPAPQGAVQTVLDEATLILPLAGIIDLDRERARLTREIDKLVGEIAKIDQKLGNAAFVAKAPEEVVEENQERREAAATAVEKLRHALGMLGD
jgi:valyl-tRNA synthetase